MKFYINEVLLMHNHNIYSEDNGVFFWSFLFLAFARNRTSDLVLFYFLEVDSICQNMNSRYMSEICSFGTA